MAIAEKYSKIKFEPSCSKVSILLLIFSAILEKIEYNWYMLYKIKL